MICRFHVNPPGCKWDDPPSTTELRLASLRRCRLSLGLLLCLLRHLGCQGAPVAIFVRSKSGGFKVFERKNVIVLMLGWVDLRFICHFEVSASSFVAFNWPNPEVPKIHQKEIATLKKETQFFGSHVHITPTIIYTDPVSQFLLETSHREYRQKFAPNIREFDLSRGTQLATLIGASLHV